MKINTSIFYIILVCLILSCTPNTPQPNPPAPTNTVNVSWQGTIGDGSFIFNGTYVDLQSTSTTYSNPGECEGNYINVSLGKGTIPGIAKNDAGAVIQFNTNVTLVGTHILNNTNNNGFQIVISKANENGTEFIASSTYPNSNVILNITEFPSNIGGLIKGSFSGDFGTDLFNNACPTKYANVSFEAIRLF
jgi:hypothetical protein